MSLPSCLIFITRKRISFSIIMVYSFLNGLRDFISNYIVMNDIRIITFLPYFVANISLNRLRAPSKLLLKCIQDFALTILSSLLNCYV